jgi:hypothetical protein
LPLWARTYDELGRLRGIYRRADGLFYRRQDLRRQRIWEALSRRCTQRLLLLCIDSLLPTESIRGTGGAELDSALCLGGHFPIRRGRPN